MNKLCKDVSSVISNHPRDLRMVAKVANNNPPTTGAGIQNFRKKPTFLIKTIPKVSNAMARKIVEI